MRAVELVVTAGVIRDEQALVAVDGFDALELGGNGIEGFVPGDACELGGAARPGAFEWVEQPIGVVLAAQIGASARAGAQLRGGEGIGAVVGIEGGDFSVPDMGDEQAGSAAVVMGQISGRCSGSVLQRLGHMYGMYLFAMGQICNGARQF